MPHQTYSSGRGTYVSDGLGEGWVTNAHNLIIDACGKKSPYNSNFTRAYNSGRSSDGETLRKLYSIFLSAKDDFNGGYIFNVDLRVSGEIFGDFIKLSKEALANGHKDVAAVLVCAALEDALKKYAEVHGLQIADKTMQEIVNSLKSAGLVGGAQKSLLDAMPKIRNMAMHADWSKISEPDVSSVLGFVEQFLLTKFSSGQKFIQTEPSSHSVSI